MADQPTVFVLGQGGAVIEMALPLAEAIADQIEKGYARLVQADGSPYVEGDRPTEAPTLPTERPALNASKAQWVGWAVVNGADPNDADGKTRTDLIEQYGLAAPDGDAQEPSDGSQPSDQTANDQPATDGQPAAGDPVV